MMTAGKQNLVAAGVFGFGVWGIAGYAIGSWNGALLALLVIGLIGCVGHTFGSLWRYLVQPDRTHIQVGPEVVLADNNHLSPNSIFDPQITTALDAFREDTDLNPFGPPSEAEATILILRDWLTAHGYLSVDAEDAL